MRLFFRDPVSTEKHCCVAAITSARISFNNDHIELFGTYKNAPAVFRVSMKGPRAEKYLEILYDNGKLNLCHEFPITSLEESQNSYFITLNSKQGR